MSGKRSPDEAKPKVDTRKSLKIYASRVFRESSVGLVSTIASTPSKRRKAFKAFTLIFCLTGFLYQSAKFLTAVFQFPTDVNVEIVRPSIFNAPAYTFCNNNGIQKSLFCAKYPDYCEEANETLCDFIYCEKNKTLVPKREYYKVEEFITKEEFFNLSGDIRKFLISETDEDPTGPYIRLRDIEEASWTLCYSLNGRVSNSLDPVQTHKSLLIKKPVNVFKFFVEEDEMFIPGNWPGILFAIHPPFEAVNPFERGIFMKPGRTYQIFVSMDEEQLLESPYGTNCINYTERWEANGRSGPRMQEMCRHECLIDVSMKCFNCVFPAFLYPTDKRMCRNADIHNITACPDSIADEFDACHDRCKNDCHRTKYQYTLQERPTVNKDLEEDLEQIDKLIIVKVYIEDDEVIVLKYSPKYMIVEVFSTIGGFIGGWLGTSLLDITDIMEGFARIIRYALKRR